MESLLGKKVIGRNSLKEQPPAELKKFMMSDYAVGRDLAVKLGLSKGFHFHQGRVNISAKGIAITHSRKTYPAEYTGVI